MLSTRYRVLVEMLSACYPNVILLLSDRYRVLSKRYLALSGVIWRYLVLFGCYLSVIRVLSDCYPNCYRVLSECYPTVILHVIRALSVCYPSVIGTLSGVIWC